MNTINSANRMGKKTGPHAGSLTRFAGLVAFIYVLLLCVPGSLRSSLAQSPDSYEPDNSYSTAQMILDPVIGVSNQQHTFHEFFDEDWLKFSGSKGKRYLIVALSSSPDCDPVIELYSTDGSSLLVKQNNSGSGGLESLAWMCSEDGMYYIRYTNNTTAFGPGIAYTLSMAMLFTGPVFPGYVAGTVASGGIGLVGARFSAGEGVGLSQADGAYILSLLEGTSTVSVHKDGYYPQSFSVSIAANQTIRRDVELVKMLTPSKPPTISGTPDTSATIYRLYSFIPTAFDPDGDSFTFSISNKPGWASFNPDTGMLIGIPGAHDIGVYDSIVIQATDSQGKTASLPPFNLEVKSIGLPGIILLLGGDN